MAMAASTYGYLTGELLEIFTGTDYSSVDSTAFSDTNLIAMITTCEEIINSILGVSAAVTVTNSITVATKFLAGWMLNRSQEDLGYGTKETNPIFSLSWKQILDLIASILSQNETSGIDSIAMSGADRYYRTFGQ